MPDEATAEWPGLDQREATASVAERSICERVMPKTCLAVPSCHRSSGASQSLLPRPSCRHRSSIDDQHPLGELSLPTAREMAVDVPIGVAREKPRRVNV